VGATTKSFSQADETREFDKGVVNIVRLAGHTIGQATFQPGWKWSETVQKIAGGDACQVHHVGMVISGTMRVAPVGGDEIELTPGNAYEIEPGHDAWVVGDEPFVGLEFDSKAIETYAKP